MDIKFARPECETGAVRLLVGKEVSVRHDGGDEEVSVEG